MFRTLINLFYKLVVRLAMGSTIEALADAFIKQQSALDALLDIMKTRQRAIDDLDKIYAENQERLSSLSQQLNADTQISDLSSKVQSSTQDLLKLVTQVQSVKIPALPLKK